MLYREIERCRICGNTRLEPILDLGMQALTGVFPKRGETVEKTPVVLVKCHGTGSCGLVQIKHSVDLGLMYGDNYGYRSGLNKSMVEHLQGISRYTTSLVKLAAGDTVLDIGSNDGTLLKSYLKLQDEGAATVPKDVTYLGMDPTIKKFRQYYDPRIVPIADFFNSKAFFEHFQDPGRKARIVTSIACFYDLEDPIAFARDVKKVLHPDGVWVFEQSYSLLMLAKNMYDTAVQEHLEYYSLGNIERILSEAGLRVREVQLNDCNGGSFRIAAEHMNNTPSHPSVRLLEEAEKILGFDLLDQLPLRTLDLLVHPGAEPDQFLTDPVLDDVLEPGERAAADEQDVRGVHLQEVLLGVLAPALGRHARHRAFDDLEQRLLHALARDIARDRGVLARARDLVDLVDVDDAALRAFDVVIGVLQQRDDDVLDVLADVAGLGEIRGVGDRERYVQDAGERLREQRLAGTRWSDEHDVGLVELHIIFTCITSGVDTLVVIVDCD